MKSFLPIINFIVSSSVSGLTVTDSNHPYTSPHSPDLENNYQKSVMKPGRLLIAADNTSGENARRRDRRKLISNQPEVKLYNDIFRVMGDKSRANFEQCKRKAQEPLPGYTERLKIFSHDFKCTNIKSKRTRYREETRLTYTGNLSHHKRFRKDGKISYSFVRVFPKAKDTKSYIPEDSIIIYLDSKYPKPIIPLANMAYGKLSRNKSLSWKDAAAIIAHQIVIGHLRSSGSNIK